MIKVKILIIDDEEDYCLIMKSYFHKKGYEVFVAHSLQQGLQMIREKRPDILFLDNKLPDGEGWDHIDQILSIQPSLHINLISAFKQTSINIDLDSYKNVKIWTKPISFYKLEEAFRVSA